VFVFKAEDGIGDWSVTGVQTCALPILFRLVARASCQPGPRCRESRALPIGCPGWQEALATRRNMRCTMSLATTSSIPSALSCTKIGRASCRERVEVQVEEQREENKAVR